MAKFEGLIAAPFTPMNEKGEIMIDAVPGYHDFLVKNKVVGAFINGSTGEGVSLSRKERMRMTEAWAKAAKDGPVTLINLVGGTSWKESAENAIHSRECGINAISIVSPYYFKPAGAGQLAEFCARIAESVPDMPVYFYHIPVLTGSTVDMYSFLKEAAPMIPNLAGIKYTHEDFMDFLSCIHFRDGKYEMLWGRDENLLSALILGTRAGVGSTYNYAAPLYYHMIGAFDRGDFATARQLQQKSIDMIRLLGKYGGIATGKAFLRYIGFDFGQFRLPVSNMTDEMYDRFEKDVNALNMEQLFSQK
jgi:N-acetylneuraminate lyase